MIRLTISRPDEDFVGFRVKFDDPADAEAVLQGKEVPVEITPAVPLTDEVLRRLSGLIGSAAQQYVADRAH